MENLKKVLKMTGNKNANSLYLSHDEFVQIYKLGKVDYRLPKRYINLFYRLCIELLHLVRVSSIVAINVKGCVY